MSCTGREAEKNAEFTLNMAVCDIDCQRVDYMCTCSNERKGTPELGGLL